MFDSPGDNYSGKKNEIWLATLLAVSAHAFKSVLQKCVVPCLQHVESRSRVFSIRALSRFVVHWCTRFNQGESAKYTENLPTERT